MNKLAVFELGVHDIKMTIFKYTNSGYFAIDSQIVEPVKLTQDMERDGYIKPTRIQETISILKNFRKIVDGAGIDNFICYATPIIATARNQIAFLDEVYKTVSLYFKILSNDEQVSALHSAIMYSFSMTRGVIMQVDDYSTQIIRFNRRVVTNSVVLPYGMLNLLDLTSGTMSERMDKVVEIISKELKKLSWLYDLEEESEFIGVGEVFESLGKLSRKATRYPLELAHNYVITQESFQNVYNLVRGLDLDKAKKLKGISEKRADLIANGFAVVKAAFNEFISGSVKVSTNSEMYGIVAKNLLGQTGDKPLLDILGYSLSAVNEFYPTSAVNHECNYSLAVILYKQLKVLHKLTRPYVKVLRIAASMCMSGKRISFENFQRNNFPVILNSNIYGASHKDIVLAAFVAASQNVDDFSLSEWVRYKDIVGEEDIDAVKKLAVIIKMATMLNITNSNSVKDVACDVLGDTVILKTEVERDATLEISQAMSVAGDFKKVYGKNLQIL